tara:strand:+ start:47 stop:529 length:483 start_codon:yes stop_codon:yes gene_type:complete
VAAGGKCRYHGALSTGPKTKAGKAKCAKNGRKTQVYVSGLNEADQAFLDRVSEGDSLVAEIMMARMQVDRILRVWYDWESDHPEDPTGMKLPIIESKLSTNDKGKKYAEVHRRRPDLHAILDRALGRVGRLVQQQATVIEIRDLKDMIEEGLANAPEAPK